MAKRKPRRTKKYAGKTEKEWRDRGEEFGKQMEKIGEDFGKHMERHGKEWKKECRCCCWPFELLGPFIGSIFGIILLMFGLWLFNFINVFRINLVLMLTNIVFANIHWFFAAFLFFGYAGYFSKRFEKSYWTIFPVVTSASVVFSLWIAVLVINIINAYADISAFTLISNLIYTNLFGFFLLFLILFYATTLISKLVEASKWKR